MKRSNLIPITRIYDIYPKYTYSDDVKKFMDEIVDIDRANVYTKDDMVAMLKKLQTEIEGIEKPLCHNATYAKGCVDKGKVEGLIQQKIDKLKGNKDA